MSIFNFNIILCQSQRLTGVKRDGFLLLELAISILLVITASIAASIFYTQFFKSQQQIVTMLKALNSASDILEKNFINKKPWQSKENSLTIEPDSEIGNFKWVTVTIKNKDNILIKLTSGILYAD